ncbi:MAG: hypothetical protein JNK82_11135 [Myxococcaceae bacterium]|nr:hypothetical protein [Myxococcaceae bacterium]
MNVVQGVAIQNVLVLLVGSGLAGCSCVTHRVSPIKVNVPRGAATGLSSGIPLGALDELILSKIDPNDASTHLRLWMEFERAPKMVMLHASQDVTRELGTWLPPFIQPKDVMPPLEMDNVFCGSQADGSLLPPQPDGTWAMEEICFGTAGVCNLNSGTPPFSHTRIKIERIAATVSQFRVSDAAIWPNGPPPFGNMINTARIQLTVQDVQVSIHERIFDMAGTQWYSGSHGLSLASLTLDCGLTPGGVTTVGVCGEPVLRCSPVNAAPLVTISGLSGMLMGVNVGDFAGVLQDRLEAHLTTGVQLHFEGFSATGNGLRIDSSTPTPLLLKLSGAMNDNCSHTPAPPPSTPAPIRGVARVRPSYGAGEKVVGDYVKPYRIRPEVKFDWVTVGPQDNAPTVLEGSFLPWMTPSGFRVFGDELEKLQPDGTFVRRELSNLRLEAGVELIYEGMTNACWQKAEKSSLVFETLKTGIRDCPACLGEKSFMSMSFAGYDTLYTREVDALAGVRNLALVDKTEVQFRDVQRILEVELGDQLCPGPNCPSACPGGQCDSWTRYDLVPSDLPDPLHPIPPVHFELWVHHELPIPHSWVEWQTGPCPPIPPGDQMDRRVVSPWVTFARFQLDSAEFQSQTVDRTFFDDPSAFYTTGHAQNKELIRRSAAGPAAVRSDVADSEGLLSTQVTLTNECPLHDDRDPHLVNAAGNEEPCWKGQFIPPLPGTVKVTRAFSGVRAERFALDDSVFGPGASEFNSVQLGWQNLAVTGTFDRSGLRFFTAVPQIYRDLGITAATRDYRETLVASENQNPWATAMYFDWQHGGAFPSPMDLTEHLRPQVHERWNGPEFDVGHRFRYFADWDRDNVTAEWVGDHPPSYCIAPEKLFIDTREMSFEGAGLKNERKRDARIILINGPSAPNGREISMQAPSTGSFWRVLH